MYEKIVPRSVVKKISFIKLKQNKSGYRPVRRLPDSVSISTRPGLRIPLFSVPSRPPARTVSAPDGVPATQRGERAAAGRRHLILPD